MALTGGSGSRLVISRAKGGREKRSHRKTSLVGLFIPMTTPCSFAFRHSPPCFSPSPLRRVSDLQATSRVPRRVMQWCIRRHRYMPASLTRGLLASPVGSNEHPVTPRSSKSQYTQSLSGSTIPIPYIVSLIDTSCQARHDLTRVGSSLAVLMHRRPPRPAPPSPGYTCLMVDPVFSPCSSKFEREVLHTSIVVGLPLVRALL